MVTDLKTDQPVRSGVKDREEVGDIAAIQSTHSNRKERLLVALNIDKMDIQREQLVSLVLDFENTFALDDWELGRSSVVESNCLSNKRHDKFLFHSGTKYKNWQEIC